MTPEQELRLEKVEAMLSLLVGSDRYTVQKDMQLFDGRNIQVGRSIGTQIGTSALQKLGFFGIVPVLQQAKPSSLSVSGSDSDPQARAAINTLRTALINLGFIA